jgi:hypothetical protein
MRAWVYGFEVKGYTRRKETSPMSEPGLLKSCFKIFGRSPALYVAIAALPYATLHAGLLALTWLFVGSIGGEGVDLRTRWLAMTTANKLEFLGLFLLWVTIPYAVAGRGICRIASDEIAGRETTFRKEVYDMLAFLPSAAVLGAIAGVVAFVGAVFLLIPGFVAGGLFSLVLPAGAVEGLGPFAALRRGFSLIGRVTGRVLILFFAYGAVVFAAMILQSILVGSAPKALSIRAPIMVICSFIPIVPLALLFICFTLLYLEARAPKPDAV